MALCDMIVRYENTPRSHKILQQTENWKKHYLTEADGNSRDQTFIDWEQVYS